MRDHDGFEWIDISLHPLSLTIRKLSFKPKEIPSYQTRIEKNLNDEEYDLLAHFDTLIFSNSNGIVVNEQN